MNAAMLGPDAIGYDPARVQVLGRRTSDSIRALDAISSSDPAAAAAMRVVRLIRHNLSDLWMPLIREIETGSSMTGWTTHPLEQHPHPWLTHTTPARGRPRQGSTGRVGADKVFGKLIARLDDDELLARLEEMSAAQVRAGIAVDPTDPQWLGMLVALAHDLDRRLAADTDGSFARALLDTAPRAPMIALAAPHSTRLSAMAPELVRVLLRVESWAPELHPVSYELGVDALLGLLVDTPNACLDLLLDERVLTNLAAWDSLDDDIVNEVVWNGLHAAVTEMPERLTDGYAVLRTLTELANGPLDDGFAPGMARGVADSLTVYIDTLAPAIRFEGDDPVTVYSFDPDLTVRLGTYDELVDLFGAVLRDEAAQASIGVTLGAYTDRVVADLGDHLVDHVGIEYVARFTDLISDAARTERAEIVLVAAASLARSQRMGSLATFGATVAVGPVGSYAGHVVRSTARTAIELAGELGPHASDDIDSASLDPSISSTIHRHITVAVLERVADDPSARTGEYLTRVTDEQWDLLREHLDDIDNAGDDLTEQRERVDRMERYIEHAIPALGGYLRTVRGAPGVNELEEDRAAVGADDDR
jgi:hypothetical protein